MSHAFFAKRLVSGVNRLTSFVKKDWIQLSPRLGRLGQWEMRNYGLKEGNSVSTISCVSKELHIAREVELPYISSSLFIHFLFRVLLFC